MGFGNYGEGFVRNGSGSGNGSGAVQVADLPYIDVTKAPYNAQGDAQMRVDGAITSGSTTFTSATANFQASDVGPAKMFRAEGAGVAGADLITYIAARVSPTTVTLAAAAGTTVSGKSFWWGTNDTVAVQAAINAASAMTPRPTILFGMDADRAAFLVNLTVPREMHLKGFNSGTALSNFATDAAAGHFSDPAWACTLFPAVSSAPVVYVPDAFGFKIERLCLLGSAAKVGDGLYVGPDTSETFGGMAIQMDQMTFGGFNKCVRNKYCNEVLMRGINMIDATTGIWFGKLTAPSGHGGVNLVGLQTIRVDYPFNTASGVGMRLTLEEADLNYGLTVARLENISFFNATTINIEDFTVSVVDMHDVASTVDIRGISHLRSDIPTVRNYAAGTNIRISGDISSRVVYQSAGTEYPDSMPSNSIIRRYSDTNWGTMLGFELCKYAYQTPAVAWRQPAAYDPFIRVGTAGDYGTLGWAIDSISGSSHVFRFRPAGTGNSLGICDFTLGAQTAGTAARLQVANEILQANASYWRMDFTFFLSDAVGIGLGNQKVGLYSRDAASMTPQYGIGMRIIGATDTNAQFEVISGGTVTVVDTGIPKADFALMKKVVIERNAMGLYMTIRQPNNSGSTIIKQVVHTQAAPSGDALAPAVFLQAVSSGWQSAYLDEFKLTYFGNE